MQVNVVNIVSVEGLTKNEILAGAGPGRQHLAALVKITPQTASGLTVLDFAGVQFATASWLREFAIGFRKYCLACQPKLVPILSNLSPAIAEELEIAATTADSLIFNGQLQQNGQLNNIHVVGQMDAAAEQTWRSLRGLAQVDAPSLQGKFPGLSLSALNNRLASLEAVGLLTSERIGRNRIYSSVI